MQVPSTQVPSTHDATVAGTWVFELQQVLQQTITQVGQQILVFRNLQIQCAVEEATLLITAESVSPIEIDPQKLLWALELIVVDCRLDSIPLSSDGHSVALNFLSKPLSIQLCLILAGHLYTRNCESGFDSSSVQPFLTPSEANSAAEQENSEVQGTSTLIRTFAPTPSSHAKQPIGTSSWFSQIIQSWRPINPWIFALIGVAYFSRGISYYGISLSRAGSASTPVLSVAASPVSVMALGRIEPQGGTTKLSVANAQESRVDWLLVKEGDRVEAGQVIAILQGLDKKKAALTRAQQNVAIARAKLAQVQAGDAKTAEISAQRANVARLEAQLRTETTEKQAEVARAEAVLRNAETTYLRYQALYQEGATDQSRLDSAQEDFETAQAQLNMVKAQLDNTTSTLQQQIQQEQLTLSKLSEVRPVDVRVVQAELDYALTQVDQAKAELQDLYVRVPTAGQILKINTHVGEQVNTNEGIVELGQTEQMYAIAEVYETDVGKIQPGQQATIVSENGGFEGEAHGTVEQIGLQIGKNNILNSDPAAEQDARVVEVKIRITPEDTAKIAGLTNMQVRVRIDLTRTSVEQP